MTIRTSPKTKTTLVILAATLGIWLTTSTMAHAQQIEAEFEITGWEETDLSDEDVRIYRTEVTKTYSGGIEGTSQSWLVMTTTPEGSAAYVGLELMNVQIGDREGTFVLKHHATATSEGQEGTWAIVPGSGTEDFANSAGTAEITVDEDGTHTLTLNLE